MHVSVRVFVATIPSEVKLRLWALGRKVWAHCHFCSIISRVSWPDTTWLTTGEAVLGHVAGSDPHTFHFLMHFFLQLLFGRKALYVICTLLLLEAKNPQKQDECFWEDLPLPLLSTCLISYDSTHLWTFALFVITLGPVGGSQYKSSLDCWSLQGDLSVCIANGNDIWQGFFLASGQDWASERVRT